MSSREDCGKDLFDHLVLANDHLLQLLLHDLPVLAKLFEDVAEVAGFRGQSFDPLRLEIILGRIAHAKLRGAAEASASAYGSVLSGRLLSANSIGHTLCGQCTPLGLRPPHALFP